MALIPNLELLIISPGAARERWVALLELADEPVPLRRCVQQGVLYGVEDEDRTPIAAVLVVDLADDVAELRAVAVAEPQQGRGLGTWIVTEVCDRLRARGRGASSSGRRAPASGSSASTSGSGSGSPTSTVTSSPRNVAIRPTTTRTGSRSGTWSGWTERCEHGAPWAGHAHRARWERDGGAPVLPGGGGHVPVVAAAEQRDRARRRSGDAIRRRVPRRRASMPTQASTCGRCGWRVAP